QIMDAWSGTITDHTNSNAPLQSAWVASVFPRAAEIIRHTSTSWPADKAGRFADMLRRVYLPKIINGSPNSNGNWELSMIEGMTAIAVFNDDHTTFSKATSMWAKRVPAYFYLRSDGSLPVPPPGGDKNTKDKLIKYWQGQTTFVDGLSQETCRDLGHTQYGLAATINAAETARHQGVDLFGSQAHRLTAAMEFHANYLVGASVPNWLCGGTLKAVKGLPTWEIAYNHFHTVLGTALPKTEKLIQAKLRPTGVDHHMDWETLTTAGTGGR